MIKGYTRISTQYAGEILNERRGEMLTSDSRSVQPRKKVRRRSRILQEDIAIVPRMRWWEDTFIAKTNTFMEYPRPRNNLPPICAGKLCNLHRGVPTYRSRPAFRGVWGGETANLGRKAGERTRDSLRNNNTMPHHHIITPTIPAR